MLLDLLPLNLKDFFLSSRRVHNKAKVVKVVF